jgi:LuxR family transcriptional regulator of csgAB operon
VFEQEWVRGHTIAVKSLLNGLDNLLEKVETVVEPITHKQSIEPNNLAQSVGLTKRELELMGLLAIGLSNADIAAKLFLSQHTVRAHLFSIYGKLNVSSRTAAIHFATINHLI